MNITKKYLSPFALLVLLCSSVYWFVPRSMFSANSSTKDSSLKVTDTLWTGKLVSQISPTANNQAALISYGYELIAHTSQYLGPNGSVLQITNGMNCQNCHLQAGTKPWGLNYGSVFANYPKFRARSGSIETIYKRVNDCLERSLNGKAIDTGSHEMHAIYAYIKWLGEAVPKGTIAKGSGIQALALLNVAASPSNGKITYAVRCESCHGKNGEGLLDTAHSGSMYLYPPLWGKHSYNDAAGLFQLSKLAGFIKNNMPFGVTYQQPILTQKEAWDLAAFINSQPRPSRDKSKDWPKLSTKPFDYPFGPYADTFKQAQHKFGPFAEIQKHLAAIKLK